MNKQNASYLVKDSDLRAKNLNKICLKFVQKVLKWTLQYVNFPGEHAPGPPRAFFLFSICFTIIMPEKNTLENMAILGAPSLKKLLNTLLT